MRGWAGNQSGRRNEAGEALAGPDRCVWRSRGVMACGVGASNAWDGMECGRVWASDLRRERRLARAVVLPSSYAHKYRHPAHDSQAARTRFGSKRRHVTPIKSIPTQLSTLPIQTGTLRFNTKQTTSNEARAQRLGRGCSGPPGACHPRPAGELAANPVARAAGKSTWDAMVSLREQGMATITYEGRRAKAIR